MNKTALIVLMSHCLCLCAALGSTDCSEAWSNTKAYNGGDAASFASNNYTANWWTKGDEPDTHSGPAGSGQPWCLRAVHAVSPHTVPTTNSVPDAVSVGDALRWPTCRRQRVLLPHR